MIKDFDSAFMDYGSARDYPAAAPEEPSIDGVQLAMGGGGGKGSNLTMTDAGMAMLDTGAGFVRGAVAQTLGLPGDLEMLSRGLRSVFNRPDDQGRIDAFLQGVREKTLLPTTDRVSEMLPPVVPAGAPDAKMRQHNAKIGQAFGEIAPLPGAIEAGVAGAKALAPTAAEMVVKSMDKLGTPVQMNIVPPGPNVVSTRLPTAKKATEDPLANRLAIDLQATKSDPDAFSHNMGLIKQYPNFVSKARTPDKQAEDFINQVKDNLLFLHDSVPEATRQRSKLWYDGARAIADRFSADYGVPDQAVAGVLAVLSPQKDWFMNVSLGQRVLDIMGGQQSFRWDDSMTEIAKIIWSKPQYAPMLDAIKGKTLAEIDDPGLKAMWLRTYDQAKLPRDHQIVSPEGDFVGVRTNADGSPTKTGWGSLNEIGKAIVILNDPSLPTISANLGGQHKVRNFYNNIYAPGDPAGHVTIDTHAVAAGLLRPLSGNSREVLHNFGSGVVGEGGPKNSSITGVQGTYGLYAEAYRRAAQERGILPREMQSITWEAVRGLFPDTFKSQAANVEQIDNIWLQYRKGKISLEEARNEVIQSAGGINAPEWERAGLRPGSAQEVQPAPNQGELSGSGVPGGNASGSGRVEPAAGDSSSVELAPGLEVSAAGDITKPAFKNWFGKSAVTDDKGQPLVVYHGTTALGENDKGIEQFKMFKGRIAKGAYFTNNTEVSDLYAGTSRGAENGNVLPVYLSIQNPATEADLDRVAANATTPAEITKALKDAGYDGLVMDVGKDTKYYVAFQPSQIKSVFNKGDWNPNDPRILHGGAAATTGSAATMQNKEQK